MASTPNIRVACSHMYVLQVIFAVGGWSGGSPTNVIESYDTRADRWILVETADTGDYRNN